MGNDEGVVAGRRRLSTSGPRRPNALQWYPAETKSAVAPPTHHRPMLATQPDFSSVKIYLMNGSFAGAAVAFGIVSPARWGRKLLDAARATPMLRFGGVFSRDPMNAADVARDYGGKLYSSYGAMLEDPDIEAILLPTPHFLHREQAEQAIAAGKHVFIEKPIATTIADAEAIRFAARAAKRVIAVGHQVAARAQLAKRAP
jgi:hypothetical protein